MTKIVGISGSLREKSYNTATLHAVGQYFPGIDYSVVTLEDVEPFNQDVEEKGWPPGVQRIRKAVEVADAVIFATPEYNYSVTGVLKNAIDWLSRPARKSPLFGKPAAIVGASMSMVGTARAQAHLRQILFYNAMPVLASAEVLIAKAQDRFDEDGHLTDQDTKSFLATFAAEFVDWIKLQTPE
ncbi:NAD(P)H-dependent oxidoreductase [Parvularcula sp. LCG005]|uniref:NADPH-dependent FMN reductase n=1 Tax=Parvularcula sp. LCG005 TaxID=3078805 RepID=UPI002942929C|nr:NAD(P)H-dependent oxidoreductase [Parvularcula sp. LCG005]WOI54061.1 NAD(P)H-dependent oxidoreductase [Parvularcula sp. LCG005]